jgi:hypothetical protein
MQDPVYRLPRIPLLTAIPVRFDPCVSLQA